MKETEFLKALNEIDDEYLLEAEHRTVRHFRRWSQRAVMIAAAVLLVVISVSATYLALHWDQIFVDRFSPTEAVLAQSADAVQEISAVSEYNGTVVRIHQTLGDETAMYMAVDVTLPDSVSLQEIADKDPDSGEYYQDIMLEDVSMLTRRISYEEISGLSYWDVIDRYTGDGFRSSSVSVETAGVDAETNTLHYLVGVSADEESVSGGERTLLIGSLIQFRDDEDVTILEGPFVISWMAENQGEVYEFDLVKDGEMRGTAKISPFSLFARLNSSEYADVDAFWNDIFIVYEDGRVEKPDGSGSGSYSSPGGTVDCSIQFNQILLLDDVAAIRIGEYECRLH